MMRLKYAKLLTILVLAVNVVLIFYTWKWFLSNESTNPSTVDSKDGSTNGGGQRGGQKAHTTIKHIKKTITIVFRDFYHFENDLHHSIESILNLIPSIQILVIYEDEPYPPLNFMNVTHPNVKFINLNFDIRKTLKALSPLTQIRTKYVLFVPDSFRFGGRAIIHKMLNEIEKKTVLSKKVPLNAVATTKSAIEERNNNDAMGGQQQTDSSSISSDGNANSKNKSPIINNKSQNKQKILIIPFVSNVKTMSNCCRINVDIANWTMEYSVKNNTLHCDMVRNHYFIHTFQFQIQLFVFLLLLLLQNILFHSFYKNMRFSLM